LIFKTHLLVLCQEIHIQRGQGSRAKKAENRKLYNRKMKVVCEIRHALYVITCLSKPFDFMTAVC